MYSTQSSVTDVYMLEFKRAAWLACLTRCRCMYLSCDYQPNAVVVSLSKK